ncbi:hypothetical protein EDE05_12852 [Neorhizobium sp. R1-B]|uniref:hypothetical protein n=1 Tax=Neorhizobium sp. R1-B TaxID=2485162 RepID=UPI001065F642|nr:hypothetical protein [Neorhizobium sp. R1-B]TDX72631.1 hypothetical protein EDE05_12852 [Neorhizobium sp. R1-B]
MSRQVNRYLKDKAMDQIDHALGRPVDPLIETYRNHFAVNADSKTAKEFDASPFWSRNGKGAPGGMAFYHVTAEGRQALKQHLKAIGDRHRIFNVTFDGHTQPVVAESASKARYSLWLDISDCFADLSFKKFCQTATVRVAA